jgi:hypothetical protein
MRVDSGYFRSFCNSLKSGNINQKFIISAFFNEKNNRTVIFLKQNSITLKWYHTKNNQGDLPEPQHTIYKGKNDWDWTKPNEYWKKWVLSLFNQKKIEKSNKFENNEKELSGYEEWKNDDLPF